MTVRYQGKDFPDFEISNKGRLRNIITGTIYKQATNPDTGYKQVCVSLGSRNNKKLFKIHRCVAESFIPNPNNKPQINHIDGVKTNNNVNNLEWVTEKENTQHAFKIGLEVGRKCEDNPCAKLTNEQVKYIRANYIKGDKELGVCALANKYGVGHTAISNVIHNKTYIGI